MIQLRRLFDVLLVVIAACTSCANWSMASDDATPALKASAHFEILGRVLEDGDLSGIAMASPQYGLIAADEGAAVQTFRLDRAARTMQITGDVSLLGDDDAADAEFDLEGVAYSDGAYYVVGSHGVAKKSGEIQPSRHALLRIPVDPITGQVVNERAGGDRSMQRTSLMRLLKADPLLSLYVDRPLQQRGLNIEGMAMRDKRLFAGLRGPNISGVGFVVSAHLDGVFNDQATADVEVHSVLLGTGYGIRDIAAVDDGFVMLLGNSAAEPYGKFKASPDYDSDRPFEIAYWDGQAKETIRLARLADAAAKAEALLVLQEKGREYEVLVLFDGAERGRPSVYRVPKSEQ